MKLLFALLVFCLALPHVAHGKTATGTLRQVVYDDFDTSTGAVTASRTRWELVRGRRVIQLGDDPASRYVNQAKMRVRGTYDVEGRLAPDPGPKGVTLKKKPVLTPAPSRMHLIAVPISFRDVPITRPWQEIVDSFDPSFARFFSRASYGRLETTVTVLPIQYSPFRADDVACDLGQLIQEALRLIDWQVYYGGDEYVDIAAIIPFDYDDHGNPLYCRDPKNPTRGTLPAGVGYIGHGVGPSPQGSVDMGGHMTKEGWPSIPHEAGHNLGLEHANALDCGLDVGGFPTNLAACENREYGDGLDTMGGIGDFNAIHKRQLGWLAGTQSTSRPQAYDTVSTAGSGFPYVGSWHLSAMGDPDADPTLRTTTGVPDVKALWLALETNPPVWATLEARFVGNNDWFWNDDTIAGVLVHTVLSPGYPLPTGDPTNPFNLVSEHGSWLLWPWPAENPTRGYRGTHEAVVRVGETLTLWPWKITVTERDLTKRWVTVDVTDARWFGAACPAAPAQCPPSPYTGEIGECRRGHCCYHAPGRYYCELG